MGLLNIIKGAYPSLQQIDKTMPADTTNGVNIVRGSLMYIASGKFVIGAADATCQGVADTTPGAYMYIALMDYGDLVAGMAGGVGQGVKGGLDHLGAAPSGPALTGLAISMPMEIETDQFDVLNPQWNPAVGEFVMCGPNGKFIKHTDGLTALGQVTQATTTRWANDAIAVTGWRTGNKVNVIRIRTMYIPNMSVA